MKTLINILPAVILLIGLNVQVQAQELEVVVSDPKSYFDQYQSMVTIHKKDGSTQEINLVYHDGSKLYHKAANSPNVQIIPLTALTKIVYSDGSQEILAPSSRTKYNRSAPTNISPTGVTPAVAATPATVPENNTPAVANEAPGEINIVLEPTDFRRNKQNRFFDVLVDGKYAATINNEKGAVITTTSGNNKIEFYAAGSKQLKSTATLMQTRANNSYVVSSPSDLKFRNRFVRDMDLSTSQKDGLSNGLSSSYTKVRLDETKTWDKSFHPFRHASVGMGAYPMYVSGPGGYPLVSIGETVNADFTLPAMNGLYLGYMMHLSYSEFETFDSWYDSSVYTTTFGIGPTLTYYLMNGKTLAPFVGVEVPYMFSGLSDSYEEDYTQSGLKASMRVGTHVYLGKMFGLTSQVRYGAEGEASFEVGIVFRFLVGKKAIQHRGTYWWDN